MTELEDLVMKMNSANCGPSEEDVCAVMLRSLPASYESLVQAFRMSVSSFNFSDLVSKLIAEEVRHKNTARVKEATVLYTRKRNGKENPKKQQERRDKVSQERVSNVARSTTMLEIAVQVVDQGKHEKEDTTTPTSHLMQAKGPSATAGLWTVAHLHTCARTGKLLWSMRKCARRAAYQARRVM